MRSSRLCIYSQIGRQHLINLNVNLSAFTVFPAFINISVHCEIDTEDRLTQILLCHLTLVKTASKQRNLYECKCIYLSIDRQLRVTHVTINPTTARLEKHFPVHFLLQYMPYKCSNRLSNQYPDGKMANGKVLMLSITVILRLVKIVERRLAYIGLGLSIQDMDTGKT